MMARDDTLPFIAATPGAMQHLMIDPTFEKYVKEGIFKDIWGSEWSGFMGIQDPGDSGEIADNAQGRSAAFSVDVSIYRCVDIRGAAIASTPLKVYDGWDEDIRNEVQHEALGVIQTTNPFNYVAGPQLLRYSLGSRDLQASFAWRLVFDTGGRLRSPLPREIYWLPPAQYKVVTGADLSPPQPRIPFAGLKVRPGQQKPEQFVPAAQVVYAPTYSPSDPLRGTSKISALKDDLNLRLYGAKSNLWFFRNNQRPDVVVTGAFSPTPENISLLRRVWKAAFGGDQSRGPAFLPADMKVQLLTIAAKDAEWLGQRHAAREDILAAFGVPPPVYGDLSRATYENIRVAYESFWRSAMIPEMKEIAWFLTQQFLWKWPDAQRAGLVLDFDYTAIQALKEDSNAVWERGMSMVQRLNEAVRWKTLTPNQMRVIARSVFKMIGLPDAPWVGSVPGGDMFYTRLTEVPIIESSVQANIDVMAARAAVTGGETNKPGNGKWVLPDASSVRASIPPRGGPPAGGNNPPPPAGGLTPGPKPLPQGQQPALPAPARAALTRGLKRYYQDQQTAALRKVRGIQPEDVGRAKARDILIKILAAHDLALDFAELEARASAIEGEVLERVNEALRSEDPLGAVRQVFRDAIEQRAAAIAQEIYEELAA